MSDRFYQQQLQATGYAPGVKGVDPPKPKRRLKKDIIAEIELMLGSIPSLDRMTIAGLEKLLEGIKIR